MNRPARVPRITSASLARTEFDPAQAAVQVLVDLERLQDQVNRLRDLLIQSRSEIERHRLELVRIRRDLAKRALPGPG